MRRRPKQARSSALTDAIITADALLLVEPGAAVTTKAIAHRAGVGIGSLYRYFSDIDEIHRAVAERYAAALDAAAQSFFDTHRHTPWRAMIDAGSEWIRHTEELVEPGLGPSLEQIRAKGTPLPALDAFERRMESYAADFIVARGHSPAIIPVIRVSTRAVIGIVRATSASGRGSLASAAIRETLHSMFPRPLGGRLRAQGDLASARDPGSDSVPPAEGRRPRTGPRVEKQRPL